MRFCPIPCPAETLQCFMCEQPMSISSCKNVTHCTPEDMACKTMLVQVGSGEARPRQSGVHGGHVPQTAFRAAAGRLTSSVVLGCGRAEVP